MEKDFVMFKYISAYKYDSGWDVELAVFPSIDLWFRNKELVSIWIGWLVFRIEWHKYKSVEEI